MILVNVTKVGNDKNVLTGSINSERFNIEYDEKVYNELLAFSTKADEAKTVDEYNLICEEATKLLKETRDQEKDTLCENIVTIKGKFYLKSGDIISKVSIPEALAEKIIESVEKNLNPLPLIKAWARFLHNPNLSDDKAKVFSDYITATVLDEDAYEGFIEDGYTEAVAKEMATFNEISFTKEGLLCCYKVAELMDHRFKVNEDNEVIVVPAYETEVVVDKITGVKSTITNEPEFADDEEVIFLPPVMGTGGAEFFCGDTLGHIIRVGEIMQLPSWDGINKSDHSFGGHGLYTGGISYVKGYLNERRQLLLAFVSPEDIAGFQDVRAGGDGGMRGRRYYIYGAAGKPTKNLYHSSTYAAILDEEWEQFKQEAIINAKKKLTDTQDLQEII